jgi:hypothetical protein
LDRLRAITPDGSILYEQGTDISGLEPERIIAVSPPPGTPVGRSDAVAVTLITKDTHTLPGAALIAVIAGARAVPVTHPGSAF